MIIIIKSKQSRVDRLLKQLTLQDFTQENILVTEKSHIEIYSEFIETDKLLIFEDFARLDLNFKNKFPKQFPENWDIVFLGGPFSFSDSYGKTEQKEFRTFAYLISKNGMKKLLNQWEYRVPMDYFITQNSPKLNIFTVNPFIVYYYDHREINVKEYFSNTYGFAETKSLAICLLKDTIDFLNKYEIDYFLISGTLLGLVRHNDFIPWDDDIDLIVHEKINSTEIQEMIPFEILKFKNSYKTFYSSSISINSKISWKWPFIDLFIFRTNENLLTFFEKEWNTSEFYPSKIVNFLGLEVKIPKNPDYFLKLNYSNNYLTEIVSGNFQHKHEIYNGPSITRSFEFLN